MNSSLTAAESFHSNSASKRPSRFFLGSMLGLMLALWSFNYIAGKIALRSIDPITLACFRIELAVLIMLPIYFCKRQRSPLCARDLWPIAYLGFFGVLINQGLFTVGLNYTTSSHSAVIIAMNPILILLLARALKLEAFTPAKLIGMGVGFLGVMLLETEHGSPAHSPFLLGDIITLGGTIGFSIYAVLGKKVAAQYDAITMNTFNCVAAGLLLLPLSIKQGIHLDWRAVGWSGWLGLIYMSAASSVAAYTLFYWLLRYMSASRVAVISYFQPVAVILISLVLLSEYPTRNLLVGTGLVLLGVYLAERGTA